MGWIEFAVAMAVFMASHRIPAMLGVKDALVARLGARGYLAVFSLLSLGLLWWVIAAAGRAPYVELWEQTRAARWGVNVVMPVAGLLTVLGVGAINPFAFEGRGKGFYPERPGIAGVTRQPLLWALLLWSGAHLWANGDVAHVVLFGVFAVFSLAGMAIVERRRRGAMGEPKWKALTRHTSLVPFAALLSGRGRPLRLPSGRVLLGALAWAVLWHLHGPVIGVVPVP